MAEYHSLERTSPKGERFVGRCIRCGRTGLTTAAIAEECPNTREMTADEALVEAVTGEQAEMTEREERLTEALLSIKQWCDAYPVDIFPEPDLKRAHRALLEHGMTLDQMSASSARHVLDGLRKIVEEVLST